MKKAYIIPLVILLLFVSVVPSFAESESETQSDLGYFYIYYPVSFAQGSSFSYNGTTYNLYSYNDYITLPVGYTLELRYSGNNIALYCNGYRIGNSSSSGSFFYTPQNHDVLVAVRADVSCYAVSIKNYTSSPVSQVGSSRTFIFDFDFPFTLSYPYGYGDIKYSSDTSVLITGSKTLDNFTGTVSLSQYPVRGTYTYIISPSVYPMVDFYHHTFESLTWFGQLPTDYFPVLYFFGAILAILVIIFVVVFLFKRFTGGKC